NVDQPRRAPATVRYAGQPRRPAQPADDARHDVGRNEGLNRGRGRCRLLLQHAPARAAGALSGRDGVAVPGAEVNAMPHDRSDFLVRTTCAALSAAASQGTVRQFGLANLFATQNSITPNYRALVCVFLNGGNDSNNMVLPTDAAGYAAYSG